MRNEALEGFAFLFFLYFIYAAAVSGKKMIKNMFVMNHFNGTERFKILFNKVIGNVQFNVLVAMAFCFISFVTHKWQYELFFAAYALRMPIVAGDSFEEMAQVIRHKEKEKGKKQIKPYSDFDN